MTTASAQSATLYGAIPLPPSAASASAVAEPDLPASVAAAPVISDDTAGELATGSIGTPSDLSQADRDFADSLTRQNARTGSVDGLASNLTDPNAVPGFMLGSLVLRPTVGQRIVYESVRDNGAKTSRVYSETTLSGTLSSDWSRHELTVEGVGAWQKNLSGTGTESPSAALDARLRLDLANELTATLGAGYSYSQESRTDPNAVAGAAAQSGIHALRASAGLQRNLGILRGSTSLEVTRTLYGDATLAGGGSVAGGDRDTLGAELTTRIGYQLSPALIPFLEASIGRETYDLKVDSTGAERSSTTLGARLGAEIDLGEKLSGEIAAGYVMRNLDDATLRDISGFTIDGALNWSPARGTNLELAAATTLESATTTGESGAVLYELDASLSHQLQSAVVARLGASSSYRDYAAGSAFNNQYSYGANAGLTWSINRYLDLEADASYERTIEPGRTDSRSTRIGLGLKLRR